MRQSEREKQLEQRVKSAELDGLALHDIVNGKVTWADHLVREERGTPKRGTYKVGISRAASNPLLIIIFNCPGQSKTVTVVHYEKWKETFGYGTGGIATALRISAERAYTSAYHLVQKE